MNAHYTNDSPRLRRILLTATLLALSLFALVCWQGLSNRHDPKGVQLAAEQQEQLVELPESVVRLMIEAVDEPETVPEPDKQPTEPENEMNETTENITSSLPEAQPSSSGMAKVTEGQSPDIEGRFDVPVEAYLSTIERKIGGKMVVWNKAKNEAAGVVESGQFKPNVSLNNFSKRARDLTRDLPASYTAPILDAARKKYGFGIWRFVLVIPESAEQQFQAAISAGLEPSGLTWADVDLLRLRYGLRGGHVTAAIESARVNGRSVAINSNVTLW